MCAFYSAREIDTANPRSPRTALAMIEVVGKLHSPVCLDTERVSCTVTFTNRGESSETVAWAGAQVHCQACVREDVVKIDPNQMPSSSPSPSTHTTFVPNRGRYECNQGTIWGSKAMPPRDLGWSSNVPALGYLEKCTEHLHTSYNTKLLHWVNETMATKASCLFIFDHVSIRLLNMIMSLFYRRTRPHPLVYPINHIVLWTNP